MTLEVVVRPLVLPDIRPGDVRDARSDDPDRGRAVIKGSGGQVIDLTRSLSANTSKTHVSEEFRVFDIVRTYRVYRPSGSAGGEVVDRNVYIDTEVMWQVIVVLHTGETRRTIYRRPQASDYPRGNVEILERDIIRKTRGNANMTDLVHVSIGG